MKRKISSVEKLDDMMMIDHVNSFVTSNTIARTETNVKKVKKPMDTRTNREHDQEDQGKDFHVGFMNSEGNLVCRVCEKIYVSYKLLYHHLRGHTDDDMEAFFNTHKQAREAEVVVESEIYDEDVIEAAKTLMLLANDHRRSMSKIRMVTHKEVHDEDLEAAKTLMLLANDQRRSMAKISMVTHKEVEENLEVAECLMLHARGHTSMVESSVHVEELKDAVDVGCKVVHEFDLNVALDVEEYNHQVSRVKRKNELSFVEKLDDCMMFDHANSLTRTTIKPINATKFKIVNAASTTTTTAPVKCTTTTNVKKQNDTRKNRRHHHNQTHDQSEVYDEDVLEAAKTLMLMVNDHRRSTARGHPSMAESSVHVEELKDTIDVGCNAVPAFDLNVALDVEDDHQ
ncbi:hypothetical protein L1987_55529 [Smallanthus sonchifolius]|uniref:Uncharacterized protein n=1 Tax=Smallanthus sonchifolius TaxID=185202 RepID=A0ACB9E9N5_9ASTR|nr:hypothetical protein L1987_55529 [Smallanthus sonchifolius]